MRKDQPKLRKQFKELVKQLRISHNMLLVARNQVEIMLIVIGQLQEELFIERIERRRAMLGKPPLTTRWYADVPDRDPDALMRAEIEMLKEQGEH